MTDKEEATRLVEEDEAATKHAFTIHAKNRQETSSYQPRPNSKHSRMLIPVKRKEPTEPYEKSRKGKAPGGIPSLADYDSDSFKDAICILPS